MKAAVYNNKILAGYLEKSGAGTYIFTYDDRYLTSRDNPPVSLTLPKSRKEYQSGQLFPFFYGLLSEGVNKDIQCRLLRIDEQDNFTRLLQTAGEDTVGAITIKRVDE